MGSHHAIDLNKGELLWQTAHGETDDAVTNHPALKGVTIPRMGCTGRVGVLDDEDAGHGRRRRRGDASDGRRGGMFRAYDKKTCKSSSLYRLPGPQTGSPMTYLHKGKQYIVVAVSGQGSAAELFALALPEKQRVTKVALTPSGGLTRRQVPWVDGRGGGGSIVFGNLLR